MFRFSARSRISFGLVCIVTSLLMMAIVLGLTPDQDKATIQGRARLSESIALASSSFILQNQIGSLEPLYESIVEHNPELRSIGLRTTDGNIVLSSGDHLHYWNAPEGEASTDEFIRIPLMDGDGQKMGTLELTCQPLHLTGLLNYVWNPWTPAIAFLSIAGFFTFSIYMGRMLEQLDPSKAVPTHVRSALNNLTEGLLVMDRKGRIVLANHSFAEIVGVDETRLIGKPASKLAWQGIKDNWVPPWDTALRMEAPQANIALQLKDKSGEIRTFNANCSPVLGTNGDYRGVLASFDDITQLEEKKAQLRLAKDAAEAASRAKSEFLANMSHEIRTPMNAILGFTDVLRRGLAESKQDVQHYLDTIHNSGKHLLELINDILDLSKVESGQFQVEITDTQPHTLISDLLSVLSVRAEERGITLSYESNGAIPATIQTDPTRFRQIITNLVGNAIKFTEHGSVKVVTSFQDGIKPMLQIDVIDTGIGMKAETIENIFNPFQQADASVTRRFGGTGLGLAISQKFARHLGGDITCVSSLGRGSTFTVTIETGNVAEIPFVDAGSLEALQSQEHEMVDPRTLNIIPSRILVVDDGDANRQLISLILKRAGMSVSEACNGEEAIQIIAQEMPFDLILMDMQMPIKDGYTTTTELRKSGYDVPIFALTGNAMKGDEEKCLAAGCTGFLTKPVDLDLLLTTLSEQLGTLSDSDSTTEFVIDTSPLEVTVSAPTFRSPAGSAGAIVSTLPLDDPEFREIVEGFIARLAQQVQAMRIAFENRDYSEIARLAHWLKGAGGTVGFPAFSKPALDLEAAARQEDQELVRSLLSQISELESRVHMPDASTAFSTSLT